MMQPTIQIMTLIITSFLVGLGISWWWFVAYSRKSVVQQQLQQELAGVRRNYEQAREDAFKLSVNLKEADQRRKRAEDLLHTTSGYDNFIQARNKLETSRKQIQQLKIELHQKDQQIYKLKDALIVLRKRLSLQPPSNPQLSNKVVRLPVTAPQDDDLLAIDGINDDIAYKLRSLGIISYRQMAESSPQQIDSLTKLLNLADITPLQQWQKTAEHLFQQKYGITQTQSKTA